MKKIVLPVLVVAVVLLGCPASRKVPAPPPPPQKEVKPTPPPPPPPVEPAAPVNTLSAKEKAAGWILLFDGTSTDGWHAYGSRTIGNAWKVTNGSLYLDATNKAGGAIKSGGDIVTDETYENFELQLEWKISKGGNSGIFIYVYEDKNKYPAMWHTGPEMQLLDDNAYPAEKNSKHFSGDLYDLIPSQTDAAKPVGQWNHAIIRSVNGKLDFYLNDIHTISTTLWNDNWRQLIRNSKFKNMPDFGTFKTGKIGLQDHGSEVAFRNIKIRRV